MADFGFFRKAKRRVEEAVSGKEKDYNEIKLSREKILADMEATNPEFDLRDDKWRNNPKDFTDKFFEPSANHTTNDIRVPEKFRDWIIGQDEALKKIELSEIEWIRTLKNLQDLEQKEAEGTKYSAILSERPTNNVLMIGEPGTGKSLIIKVMAESLKEKYKEEGIEMEDVLVSEDRVNRYKANVRYIKPAGSAKKVVDYAQIKETQKSRKKNLLIYSGLGAVAFLGALLMSFGLRSMVLNILGGESFSQALLTAATTYFYIGVALLFFPLMILMFFMMMRGGMGIGGATGGENLKIPNLLVDNDPESAQMYVNCTLVTDASLFGSIEWPLREDTQVLTRDGIKTIMDITMDDEVATLSHDTGKVEWQKPTAISPTSYFDEVYEVRTPSIHFVTGPNHNMYVAQRKYIIGKDGFKEFALYPAKSLVGKRVKYKRDAKWEGHEIANFELPAVVYRTFNGKIDHYAMERHGVKDIKIEDWLEFMGYWISDGWTTFSTGHYIIGLSQTKPESKKKFISVLNRLGLLYHEDLKGNLIIGSNKHLWAYLVQFGKANNKFIDPELKDLSPKLLQILFDALMEGDGSMDRFFYTTSTKLRDDVIEIALKIGRASTFRSVTKGPTQMKDGRVIKGGQYWQISISKNHLNPQVNLHRGKTLFEGLRLNYEKKKFKCISVPNGIIYAGLNGRFAWVGNSPWQTGAMAKPPFRRVQAGKIHEANKKILYIDEIRNVSSSTAIKLLTAMEDGEMPIQAQSDSNLHSGGGGTAGQNIQTPPIKSMFFLFAAGNLDVLDDPNSILNKFPALRDRFENYGDIISLKDEVEATPLNEMLVSQVIRDELYRFQFPAMEAAGVKRIIDYIKQRASDKNHIKLMFRAVIKVLKRSAQLSWKDGQTIILDRHVKDAIEHYTESIEKQVIEHRLEKKEAISLVKNEGVAVGLINGLAVVPAPHGNEGAGDVMQVQSYLKFVDGHNMANFEVTGVVRGDETDAQDSKREVRTLIFRLYGIDIAKECYTHIRFSQTRVDGPSAGITMTLSLMSWLGDPSDFKKRWKEHLESGKKKSEFPMRPVPLRQDVAVTGAAELREEKAGDIKISAIGGVYEKIRGAKRYGIKYVLIPRENYDGKIISKDQFEGIKVIPADTVLSYWECVRGDGIDGESSEN